MAAVPAPQPTDVVFQPGEPESSILSAGKYLHLPENSRLPGRKVMEAPPKDAAIFLDRDGVIIEDVHFCKSPTELHLLPKVAGALRVLKEYFYIIVVTNQSGIAHGLFTERDLLAIHSELVRQLARDGATLDAIYYCPHLPEGIEPDYRSECQCRKPKPGMLLRARDDWGLDLAASFTIGDSFRDVEADRAAGTNCILIDPPGSDPRWHGRTARDLAEAAHWILDRLEERASLRRRSSGI